MSVLPLARRRRSSVRVPLHDGGAAHVRPLDDGESGPLLDVFAGLSAESRASRYLVGMPRLPGPVVHRLSATDGVASVAWLASVDGRPAGIGRYIATSGDACTAEVAFEVVDEHQRRGLGAVLLDTIMTVAAVNGVRHLQATVLPTNGASVRLLSRVGLPMSLEDGLLEGSGPLRLLDPALVDRHAVVELARRSAPAPPESVWTAPCAAAH